MREIKYNRQAAVRYARRWALGRNPDYYDFETIGGDCTNFVSQCIYAGARVMNFTPVFGWYYLSLSDRSPSWSGVEFLYNFLTENMSVGPYGSEVSRNRVMVGDVVQFRIGREDFQHTAIITKTSPRILVAAHSRDVLDVPLSRYDYEKIRFLHIDGVRTW